MDGPLRTDRLNQGWPSATRSGPLIFSGSLVDLTALGLVRPSLDAFLAGADVPQPHVDRAYLVKVLDEEIARPFGHPLRPVVELVLNAADAYAVEARLVDVCTSDGKVEVKDKGEGMSLRAILSRLLLPFATDKRADVDIGRFGVGFFSVLGLGISDPNGFALDLETGDGRESHALTVLVQRSRADESVGARDFYVEIRKAPPRRGTRVRVASRVLDASSVRAYLRDALHFFPVERGIVRVDGASINDGTLVSGGRTYADRVVGEIGAVARFHLGGRGLAPGITAATYHAGVKVESCFALGELALLDFPGSVELTEGRDAIKPTPAFARSVKTFAARLVRLAEEARDEPDSWKRFAELAAQMSALMLDGVGWTEIAPELAKRLLAKKYLVTQDRAEAISGFLGASVEASLFVPESFWAERQWQPYVPGERELLDDHLFIGEVESLAALARRRPDLGGLQVLAAHASRAPATMVALARGKRRAAGALPCLGTRRAVLLREDVGAMKEPRSWSDLYALRTSFDRAAGAREPDVERDLIVLARLGEDRLVPGHGDKT